MPLVHPAQKFNLQARNWIKDCSHLFRGEQQIKPRRVNELIEDGRQMADIKGLAMEVCQPKKQTTDELVEKMDKGSERSQVCAPSSSATILHLSRFDKCHKNGRIIRQIENKIELEVRQPSAEREIEIPVRPHRTNIPVRSRSSVDWHHPRA